MEAITLISIGIGASVLVYLIPFIVSYAVKKIFDIADIS